MVFTQGILPPLVGEPSHSLQAIETVSFTHAFFLYKARKYSLDSVLVPRQSRVTRRDFLFYLVT